MEFMNRQEIFESAVRHVSDTIMLNQQLYLAQIIKIHPNIDLMKYRMCYRPLEDAIGTSFWLEEIK